jgi:hypothetical protein
MSTVAPDHRPSVLTLQPPHSSSYTTMTHG